MFRIITTLTAVAALLLGASQAANADGNRYRGNDSSAFRHDIVYRSAHMPHWLVRDSSFRYWYARSPYRFDYRLRWVDLNDAYRWERRYRRSSFSRSYYRTRFNLGNRRFNRIDRNWRKDKRRNGRDKKRRRDRDDD